MYGNPRKDAINWLGPGWPLCIGFGAGVATLRQALRGPILQEFILFFSRKGVEFRLKLQQTAGKGWKKWIEDSSGTVLASLPDFCSNNPRNFVIWMMLSIKTGMGAGECLMKSGFSAHPTVDGCWSWFPYIALMVTNNCGPQSSVQLPLPIL